MKITEKISAVQKNLQEEKINGWLLYDFRQNNPLALEFLNFFEHALPTRRFFYWIPAKGDPIKIVHKIESQFLDFLPGSQKEYFSWQTIEETLKEVLKDQQIIAMEYSPRNANPYVSKVDAGILELVQGCGVQVLSSAPFLQAYTSTLSEKQLLSHIQAAHFLEETVQKVWDLISTSIKKGIFITEYDVQQFVVSEMKAQCYITDHPPVCAVNQHSALPHYAPTKQHHAPIQKEDFILIDLWCKKKSKDAIFADITRVAIVDIEATEKQIKVHQIVRKAQKDATDYIQSQLSQGRMVKGCDVDRVARTVIEDAGYGIFFIHRTGHNIHTKLHGPGAHLDSLETLDERFLIPRTCFSIEPGIYLPNEFGIRQEYDVYISSDNKVSIFGGFQDFITSLV